MRLMLLCVAAGLLGLSWAGPAARSADAGNAKPAAAPADSDPGAFPTGPDGKPLNLGFETGTLQDWTAAGEAFAGQPVTGDLVARRRADMRSNHAGQFWIGGFEIDGDKPRGTLTSVAFKATQPWGSFLIGGGAGPATRVEVVRAEDNSVVFKASGRESETMSRVAVDLRPVAGKDVFIRLVDESSAGWGHVNFDDFRFHATQPKLPKGPAELVSSLPADEVKNAGLSPQDAAKAITLPEGFKATLFAGEPDVVQPVGFALDDRGRLWVAEANTYPKRAPEGQGKDRVVVFEDADGDGHFDKRTVFVEGLNLVSGIEVGFGGVWVGAAPNFLFIPVQGGINADDPKPAGEPRVVLDGFGYQDTHELLNSFAWGPDGWLYGCHGVFTHSKVGKPGAPDARRVPMNAAVWRYHPTKEKFEIFAEGASNQWGVDFNDWGQGFITACVIPHLYHVVQGGRYQRQAGQHFEPYTFRDIKTIADHAHWATGAANQWASNGKSGAFGGGHAHCGAMIYLGDNWPAPYRGQVFMNNIHGNRMNEDLLERAGSGYVARHGPDFLRMNDKWSRLIALKYGPDGGVYVIDWYDKQACHLPNPEAWDRGNGRIYKIRYEAASGPARKSVPADLSKLSAAELMGLQLHANDWVVRHARRVLQERAGGPEGGGTDWTPLAKMLAEHPDPTRRLRAMWALHAGAALGGPVLLDRLRDENEYVRAWAVQLAVEGGAASSELARRLAELAAADPSSVVRLYLASAAGRLPPEQRWDVLSALAMHGEDAGDPNLPLLEWYALEPLVPGDVKRAVALAARTKIPTLREFIARRIAAGAK